MPSAMAATLLRALHAVRGRFWRGKDKYSFILAESESGEKDVDSSIGQEGTQRASDRTISIPTILALCCSAGGLQFFWSTIMANLAPLLQRLGLAKMAVAITLISQPLSGVFVGPYAGYVSDNLSTRWGKRKPLIVLGAAGVGVSLILLAWVDEIVRLLTCPHGTCGDYEQAVRRFTQVLAVANTLALSVSVQPLQSGIRSLVIDETPFQQQSYVSAWTSVLTASGSVAGFLAGSISLPARLGILRGMSQFQALALVTITVVVVTASITCICSPATSRSDPFFERRSTRHHSLSQAWRSLRLLPPRVLWVCNVQCSSWIAWFCVLYYTTTYITELSTNAGVELKTEAMSMTVAQVGTSASLYAAIVALIATSVIPILLVYQKNTNALPTSKDLANGDDHVSQSATLGKIWAFSEALCGIVMLATLFATSMFQGTLLTALLGLPFAVTQWVPYAILGNEISSLQQSAVLGGRVGPQSGLALGIHNMAISVPQILAGVMSSVVYAIAESAGSPVPTAWVLGLGGLAAFAACRLACRLLW